VRSHPFLVAVVVGCAGLALLAVAWLSPIRSDARSCGSLVGSVGTFTNHSVRDACQAARTRRFVIGLLLAALTAIGSWAVLLAAGWARFRRR
jgi:hypothetical protein